MKIFNINNRELNIRSQKMNPIPTESTENTKNDILNILTYSPASLSFQSTRKVALKPLNFSDSTIEALVNKIKKTAVKLEPGSEFPVRLFDLNGARFGYKINKNENSETIIIIKNLIDTLTDWNKTKNKQSELKFTVNSDGCLETAVLSKKINDNFSKRFDSYIEYPNRRRIHTNEGLVLLQSMNNENIWNTRPCFCKNRLNKAFDVTKDFNDIALADIFFELSKKHTSLFA